MAALTDPPQTETFQARPLSPAEIIRFLEQVASNHDEALYVVAVMLGLRKSEILGLSWGGYLPPNESVDAVLDEDVRPSLRVGGVALMVSQLARMAVSLTVAVESSRQAPRDLRPSDVSFGRPPHYVRFVGTGWDVSIPDVTQDPFCNADSTEIRLDVGEFLACATWPFDVAAVVVLDELVHASLNARDGPLASVMTTHLFGGFATDGGTYFDDQKPRLARCRP